MTKEEALQIFFLYTEFEHFGFEGGGFEVEELCSPPISPDAAIGFAEDTHDVFAFCIILHLPDISERLGCGHSWWWSKLCGAGHHIGIDGPL